MFNVDECFFLDEACHDTVASENMWNLYNTSEELFLEA